MNRTYALADELRAALLPGCERLEIAGSIRRGKPDPKDIELVGIAKRALGKIIDLFGNVVASADENLLEAEITNLRFAGQWDFDHVLKRNGPKYKRLRHIDSGICCDLFISDAEGWGIDLALRTGPGDFSKALVTRAHKLSMFVEDLRLHQHTRQYKMDKYGDQKPLPCEKGQSCPLIVPTPDETAFFAALDLPRLGAKLDATTRHGQRRAQLRERETR